MLTHQKRRLSLHKAHAKSTTETFRGGNRGDTINSLLDPSVTQTHTKTGGTNYLLNVRILELMNIKIIDTLYVRCQSVESNFNLNFS